MKEFFEILNRTRICVLATESGGVPHTSLMACAFDEKRRSLIVATGANTKKFSNISLNPNVSVLVDTRLESQDRDLSAVKALSLSGRAIRIPKEELQGARELLCKANPDLSGFLNDFGLVLLHIEIKKALFLDGPQNARTFFFDKEYEMEELSRYFEETKGFGVLSSAGKDGEVNAAVYGRPHFMDDGSLAFLMQDRLNLKNVRETGKAHYLFREDGPGYSGKRLALSMVGESDDQDLAARLRRREKPGKTMKKVLIVCFKVERVLPLIGADEDDV
ncbi:MAG: pyridoxamine 5'-phosphate oxidase family protein [Deltaproteobacteria bacterium]|nr:pyridoxamine 5'-phosphate oxidase family protein [Deltaproteobacteria bacterium]